MELLGISIRQNNDIQGFKVKGTCTKAGQFADDLWSFLKNIESVNAILRELEYFYAFSGLKINSDKCVVLKVGPHRHTEARFYTLKKLIWSTGSIKILGIDIHPDIEMLQEQNYNTILPKVEEILHTWSKRQLTTIGRITIINSLISTLFVHKFLALPSPTSQFFTMYKKLITKFLWSDGPAKIAYNKLIQDHENMGLKLVDLELKDLALKAAWPVRWNNKDPGDSKLILNQLPIKDSSIWDCNIKSSDISKITPPNLVSPIYAIWSAWAKLTYNADISDFDEIIFQTICGNSNIRQCNSPVFNKVWLPPSANKIIDLVHPEEHRFYTYNELKDFFPNVTFLQYCGILAAIPRRWKVEIRNTNFDHIIDPINALIKYESRNKVSRNMYWDMLEFKFPTTHTSKHIWERELKINIADDLWASLLPEFFKMVKPTKLRYLQYRLFLRAITTNVKRNKWNPEISPLCSFCQTEKETIHHLFWGCELVHNIWLATGRIIAHFLEVPIVITEEMVMLNNYRGTKKTTICNILIIVKQYVYSTKCLGESLNFSVCVSKIADWHNIDKQCALKNHKMVDFNKRWNNMF